LPVLVTPILSLGLLLLTIVMCVSSAIAAIIQVTRIDPARVFKQ
jgi:putative ABC transport system permease protein